MGEGKNNNNYASSQNPHFQVKWFGHSLLFSFFFFFDRTTDVSWQCYGLVHRGKGTVSGAMYTVHSFFYSICLWQCSDQNVAINTWRLEALKKCNFNPSTKLWRWPCHKPYLWTCANGSKLKQSWTKSYKPTKRQTDRQTDVTRHSRKHKSPVKKTQKTTTATCSFNLAVLYLSIHCM